VHGIDMLISWHFAAGVALLTGFEELFVMTSCLALMTFWLTAHGARTSTFRSCCTFSHAWLPCTVHCHCPGIGKPSQCALVSGKMCGPWS
jgi:hypothetical protein